MVGPSPSMVLYLERWLGREPGFVGLDLGLGVAMEGPSFLEKVVGFQWIVAGQDLQYLNLCSSWFLT